MLRLLGDCTTSMAFLSWTLHTTGCNSCRNLKRKKADFIRYGICIWETNMVVSKPFRITAVNHFMAVEAASCNVIATVVYLTYIDNLGYEIITVVCPCMSRRLLYSKLVADSSSTSHLHWSFQGFAMARGSHDLRNPVCSYEVGKQKKTARAEKYIPQRHASNCAKETVEIMMCCEATEDVGSFFRWVAWYSQATRRARETHWSTSDDCKQQVLAGLRVQ